MSSKQQHSEPGGQTPKSLRLAKLDKQVPDPIEILPGLWEVKLYAGDKDKYLLQNNRREFSTRLAVDLPEGVLLQVWQTDSMSKHAIGIDGGVKLVTHSTPELKVDLWNRGWGAYHQKDWEFSVLLQLVVGGALSPFAPVVVEQLEQAA